MRRRSVVPFVLGSLVLCAWLHARGVGALVGAGLGVPELRVVQEAQAAPEPPPERSAEAILARNPFDSVTGPLVGRPGPEPAPEPDATLPPCDGVRVASVVAADDPDWSFVMLEVRGERGPILRRRGSEVLAIGAERVVLEQGGRRCLARIFPPAPGPEPSPGPSSAVAGIVRRGPGEYAVDRRARDALVEGAADLMRAVAVRPEKAGDDVVGLRIATLRPGTPLEALGVRAGDVLASLDGIPLTSPDRMLEAYARLRSSPHLRLVIVRDGRQEQLDYDIR